MRSTKALTITLPRDMAQMVEDKVASGEYASESDVLRAGLRLLGERDAALEKWLREEVAPAYDEMKAHPERVLSADEMRKRLHARIDALATKPSRRA